MIRIRDLRVDYDNVCAVRDLSLEVEPGEVCGLIGPNGAGKTTTMRAMIGLIEPTYGEINVMGVDVRERPQDVCRLAGFMPDFPPVYEDLLGLGVSRPVRGQLWHAARPAADRGRPASRDGRPGREAQRACRRAVAWHAAAADARQDLDSRAAGPLARRAGQRRRSAGADRSQEYPPSAGCRGEDGLDLVAHPGRDERVLHVGRDHGARNARGQPAGSTTSIAG